MGWMQVRVRRKLVHGRSLRQHTKPQKFRRVPNGNRFDKRAGGEYTVPDCPHTMSVDVCFDWVGHSGLEQKLVRFGQIWKLDQVWPDAIGGSINDDGACHRI